MTKPLTFSCKFARICHIMKALSELDDKPGGIKKTLSDTFCLCWHLFLRALLVTQARQGGVNLVAGHCEYTSARRKILLSGLVRQDATVIDEHEKTNHYMEVAMDWDITH